MSVIGLQVVLVVVIGAAVLGLGTRIPARAAAKGQKAGRRSSRK